MPVRIDRNRRRLAMLLGGLLLAASCGGSEGPTTATIPSTMSEVAGTYLEQVFAIMKTRSIKRLSVDWNALHTRIFTTAANAQTIANLYPAIREAMTIIGDGHSSFTPPAGAGAVIFVPNRTCRSSGAATPTITAPVGYVRVGSFGGNNADGLNFANTIQGTIAAGDRDDLAGWIVDLRGNGGGNMWPMIAGVGPILGDGIAGYFIDPVGAISAWEYRDGASILAGAPLVRLPSPYRLRRTSPKVAVLVDNGVASSGEATAVAFKKRPNTRFFGVATCGLSTANSPFTLSDGAVLNLTVSTMADRTRTMYGDQLLPDEVISGPNEMVQRAIAWLRSP
jgi:hypothetical protein